MKKTLFTISVSVLCFNAIIAQNYFEGTIIREIDRDSKSMSTFERAALKSMVTFGSSEDYIAIKGNKFLCYETTSGLINFIDADSDKFYIINARAKIGIVVENYSQDINMRRVAQSSTIFGNGYIPTGEMKEISGVLCEKQEMTNFYNPKEPKNEVWLTTDIKLSPKLMHLYKCQYSKCDKFIIESNNNKNCHLVTKEISFDTPSDAIMTIPEDIKWVDKDTFNKAHGKSMKQLNKERKKQGQTSVKLKVDDNVWDF